MFGSKKEEYSQKATEARLSDENKLAVQLSKELISAVERSTVALTAASRELSFLRLNLTTLQNEVASAAEGRHKAPPVVDVVTTFEDGDELMDWVSRAVDAALERNRKLRGLTGQV